MTISARIARTVPLLDTVDTLGSKFPEQDHLRVSLSLADLDALVFAAIHACRTATLNTLLRGGANANASIGKSALEAALEKPNAPELVALLVRYGADAMTSRVAAAVMRTLAHGVRVSAVDDVPVGAASVTAVASAKATAAAAATPPAETKASAPRAKPQAAAMTSKAARAKEASIFSPFNGVYSGDVFSCDMGGFAS